jgi:hypothetical protein
MILGMLKRIWSPILYVLLDNYKMLKGLRDRHCELSAVGLVLLYIY